VHAWFNNLEFIEFSPQYELFPAYLTGETQLVLNLLYWMLRFSLVTDIAKFLMRVLGDEVVLVFFWMPSFVFKQAVQGL
jgi:hypothetical protein